MMSDAIVEKFGRRVPWLFFFGVVLVVISLYLAFEFEPKEVGYKVILAGVAELGFAAVIACLIIVTIDHSEKQKYKAELLEGQERLMSAGFASYVSGVNLPKEISDNIKSLIAGSPFVKSYNKNSIDLEYRQDHALLTQRSVYVVRNVGYEVKEFELPVMISANVFHFALAIEKRNEFDEWEVVQEVTDIASDGTITSVSDWIDPLKITLEPEESARIRALIQMKKYHNDSHLLSNTMNCESWEMDVTYPAKSFGVDCRLTSQFPEDECVNRTESEPAEGLQNIRVAHLKPFLRGNCGLIWWTKRQNST